MKFMIVNSEHAWYYGKVGQCFPVMEITNDIINGDIYNIVHSYDGDKKQNKPFGDECEVIFNESNITILECDVTLAKDKLIEAVENEDIEDLKMFTIIIECIKLSKEA